MPSAPPTGAHLWLILWKAFRAIETFDNRSIDELGLCRSDFAVLEILLHKGALPVNAVGRKILLTSGSITIAVSRLEKRGLVRRVASQPDKRVVLVELTDAGRELIAPAFFRHAANLEKLADELSPAEREKLATLLKRLGKHAESLTADEGS